MEPNPSIPAEPSPSPSAVTVLQPMFDRLLILRDEAVKFVGGIELPAGAVDIPNTGTVVATGEGRLCPTLSGLQFEHESGRGVATMNCHVEPLRIKVGDRVLFQAYAGTVVKDPSTGQPLILCVEDDILALLKEVNHAPRQEESPAR